MKRRDKDPVRPITMEDPTRHGRLGCNGGSGRTIGEVCYDDPQRIVNEVEKAKTEWLRRSNFGELPGRNEKRIR